MAKVGETRTRVAPKVTKPAVVPKVARRQVVPPVVQPPPLVPQFEHVVPAAPYTVAPRTPVGVAPWTPTGVAAPTMPQAPFAGGYGPWMPTSLRPPTMPRPAAFTAFPPGPGPSGVGGVAETYAPYQVQPQPTVRERQERALRGVHGVRNLVRGTGVTAPQPPPPWYEPFKPPQKVILSGYGGSGGYGGGGGYDGYGGGGGVGGAGGWAGGGTTRGGGYGSGLINWRIGY